MNKLRNAKIKSQRTVQYSTVQYSTVQYSTVGTFDVGTMASILLGVGLWFDPHGYDASSPSNRVVKSRF